MSRVVVIPLRLYPGLFTIITRDGGGPSISSRVPLWLDWVDCAQFDVSVAR